ncbi:rCG43422 [Rattus norvegicus]|uniref:RCG43422 n=1 Tax=Rattus norvegicus TaxID=10116 RepID=A6JJ85_RAT|nr:rCG43422 [Rattus norvegicus]
MWQIETESDPKRVQGPASDPWLSPQDSECPSKQCTLQPWERAPVSQMESDEINSSDPKTVPCNPVLGN